MEVNYRCAAIGCDSDQSSLNMWRKGICNQHKSRYGTSRCDCAPPFTLYPFPSERTPMDRDNWIDAFNSASDIVCNPDVDKYLRVCSKHFVAGKPTQMNPVPTLHLCMAAATPTSSKKRRRSNSGIMKSPVRNSPRKNLRLTASAQTTPVGKAGIKWKGAKVIEPPTTVVEDSSVDDELEIKLKSIQEENDSESDSAERTKTKVMFKLPQTHKDTQQMDLLGDIIDIDYEIEKEKANETKEPLPFTSGAGDGYPQMRHYVPDTIENELQHFSGFISSHMRHLPLTERIKLQQNIINLVLQKRVM